MIEMQREDFCFDEVIKRVKAPKIGALSIYLGTVREFPEGAGLEFGDNDQAVHKLRQIREKAISRFDVEDVAIVHRTGFLGISENIVLIVVSATHRGPAFRPTRSVTREGPGRLVSAVTGESHDRRDAATLGE